MDLGLKGRNAIVLGGTRGIGRAIAGTLAGEGTNVAVCARNTDQITSTVAELKSQGVRATGIALDITDGAALKSWIAGVAQELGSIDMLFSNAGAMAQGGDPASWEQNFRLDVLGAVNAFEGARPFLEASGEKTGDTSFVIISSISAAQADTASSYGPIKAALVHMAKGLARQHAPKKIRVNVVSPGTVYFRANRTCPSDIRMRSRAIQPAAWPRRRKLPMRRCFWRARPPRSRPVQISSWTERSRTA
jgi:3-oxoacyl-[acyl-carrier protein] reductase